jgi:hypothetical protein
VAIAQARPREHGRQAAQAERFLNKVKSIFGVHHCTYLVSVSEEAADEFERRVVRVRTLLESALDEILRIPGSCAGYS